jgi:protein-L-isoaspartate(D-aspartate) O-methyltransferase
MRLRGAFAGPEQLVALGPEPGLLLSTASAGAQSVPPETAYDWLTGPYQDTRTGLQITRHEVPPSLSFWVSVHEPQACELLVDSESALRAQAACLLEYQGSRPGCMSLGVLDPAGLCLLWLAPARLLGKDNPDTPRELWFRTYGPASRTAVRATLQQHLNNWHAAGRPGTAGMRVRVYALGQLPPAGSGIVQVTKRWSTLVIDWPGG